MMYVYSHRTSFSCSAVEKYTLLLEKFRKVNNNNLSGTYFCHNVHVPTYLETFRLLQAHRMFQNNMLRPPFILEII